MTILADERQYKVMIAKIAYAKVLVNFTRLSAYDTLRVSR